MPPPSILDDIDQIEKSLDKPPPSILDDIDQLEKQIKPDPRMEQAKEWAKKKLHGQKELLGVTVDDVVTTGIPFLSAGVQYGRSKDYQNAREAYSQGKATDKQVGEIAQYELNQDRQRAAGTGHSIVKAAVSAPAMVGEALVGGGAVRAGLGLASRAAPILGKTIPTALGRTAQAAAIQAAATPVMVSSWLPQAQERAIKNGGSLWDEENLGPAGVQAVVNNAVLGTIGQAAPAIGGKVPTGVGRLLGTAAAGGAIMPAEQQAADALLSRISEEVGEKYKIDTKYGTIGHLLRGETNEAVKKVATEAFLGAGFATFHTRKVDPVAKLGKLLDSYAKQGLSDTGAARAVQKATGGIFDTIRQGNLDAAKAYIDEMPVGPAKAYAESLFEAAKPSEKPTATAELTPTKTSEGGSEVSPGGRKPLDALPEAPADPTAQTAPKGEIEAPAKPQGPDTPLTAEELWSIPLLGRGEIEARGSPWKEASVHRTHEEAARAAGPDGGVKMRAGPKSVMKDSPGNNPIALPEWVAYKKAGSEAKPQEAYAGPERRGTAGTSPTGVERRQALTKAVGDRLEDLGDGNFTVTHGERFLAVTPAGKNRVAINFDFSAEKPGSLESPAGKGLAPGTKGLVSDLGKIVKELAKTGTEIEYTASPVKGEGGRTSRADFYARQLEKAGYEQVQQGDPTKPSVWRPKSNLESNSAKPESGQGPIPGKRPEPPIVQFRKDAKEIESALPTVEKGNTRLWRGNRPGEEGKNPQFTNDLPGIALPFRKGYGGKLTYVDVPTVDLAKYEQKVGAAPGAEFVVPPEVAAKAKLAEPGKTITADDLFQQSAESRTAFEGLPLPPDQTKLRGGTQGNPGDLNPTAAKEFAMQRSQVTEERAARGEDAILKEAEISDAVVWKGAMDAMKVDPEAAAKLVDRLDVEARAPTRAEQPLLLVRRVALSNQLDTARMEKAILEARMPKDSPEVEQLRRQVDDTLAEQTRLDKITSLVGSEAGGLLRFYRRLVAQDYSLNRMLEGAKDAKQEPLTDAERKQIEKMSDRIKELEDQLAKIKDGKEPKDKETDTEVDINRQKRDYRDIIEKFKWDKMVIREKAGVIAKDTYQAFRGLITSFDLSVIGRQGLFALTRPHKAIPNAYRSLKHLASERVYDKAMLDIQKREKAPLYEKANIEFTAVDADPSKQSEEFMGRFWGRPPTAAQWANKKMLPINVLKAGVAASSRQFNGYLNLARADMADLMIDKLARNRTATPAELAAIGGFINPATGRGSLPDIVKGSKILNETFFSFRNLVSRFQLITGQPFIGGRYQVKSKIDLPDGKSRVVSSSKAALGGSWRARRIIAEEYGRMAIGLGLLYTLTKAAAGDEMELTFDPRSADFGKMKFGSVRIDPLAGMSQASVFLSRMLLGETKDQSGKVTDIRRPLLQGTLRKTNPKSRDNALDVAQTFARNKLAPFPGLGADLLTGEDFKGDPIKFWKEAGKMTVPLAIGDVVEAMEKEGVTRGTALGLLGIMGWGIQNYEKRK